MLKYLSSINLKNWRGKTCLLRIDLNVEPGGLLDSYRLEAIIPTIKLLLKNRINIVILSHRGRPLRKDKRFSLRPFISIIGKKIKQKVVFLPSLPHAVVSGTGKVFLMENLRFFRGEETNDPSFARKIAKFADFYVNDAFAVSHRKNASVAAITKYLPSYAGLLLEKEIKNLSRVMNKPKHPFTIIIGGAKTDDKVGIIKYFWALGRRRADHFLVTGGPANTFLAAKNLPVWNSVVDRAAIPFAKKIMNSPKIFLPNDLKIGEGKILDIGPRTARQFGEIVGSSRTIIWSGPPGLFEKKKFSFGTKALWKMILKNKKALRVVGGGETVASIKLITQNLRLVTKDKNLFLSTGGGAMLEFLSGKKLPGMEALK